jgi:hypothetical protein
VGDQQFSFGDTLAGAAWLFAFLTMVAGTSIAFATDYTRLSMTFLAWGIFFAAVAGTITIRECTKRGRAVMREAIRMMAAQQREDPEGVARIRR